MKISSLSGKFLATVVPTFLIAFITFVGAYEWVRYHDAHDDLTRHINRLAASQSIILAEPVAAKDKERLGLLLATVISDGDLIGISVFDENGDVLDSFGTLTSPTKDLNKRISINFADDQGFRKVGELLMVMTISRIVNETRTRLLYDGILALALLISGIFAAVFAHQRIVVQPLSKLLAAIKDTRGGAREVVDWSANDEIGTLISNYNEMQGRLSNHEADLQEIQNQLERRIEERTRDLVMAREAAEAANQAKTQFLTSMSHELRTPMNAILGFTQLIQRDPMVADNARIERSLKTIHSSGQHLMALIDQVLNLNKLESENDDTMIVALEPLLAIEEGADLLAPLAEARQIAIEIDSDIHAAGRLLADTLQFKQVVLNLLSNAVKYNRREGKVVVRADRSGKFVRISVADTGHGIPSEMFENIFKPFNRLGREAGNIEGSGVGLTLTRKMVEKMQGEIGFESAEGEGSTFWVLLPSVAEPQSEGRV